MITAAPNEHKDKIASVRAAISDLTVAPRPLPGGDYMWDAHNKVVALEMKWSLSDLLASLSNNEEHGGPRLAVETRKLLDFADIPILLVPTLHRRGDGAIEGAFSNWQYASVKGILADIHLYGLIVDEWDGHMVDRLASWYYTLRKTEHHWIKQLGRPSFVPVDVVYHEDVWALSAYRGVGPELATKLLQEYGSVEDVLRVCREQPERLTELPKLGPKKVARLHEVANRRW